MDTNAKLTAKQRQALEVFADGQYHICWDVEKAMGYKSGRSYLAAVKLLYVLGDNDLIGTWPIYDSEPPYKIISIGTRDKLVITDAGRAALRSEHPDDR